MELGGYLKGLRERKEMTLLQVHEATNIPTVTLYHYEVGRRQPSAERIETLASVYGVPSRYLLALAGHYPERYLRVQKELAQNYLDAILNRVVVPL